MNEEKRVDSIAFILPSAEKGEQNYLEVGRKVLGADGKETDIEVKEIRTQGGDFVVVFSNGDSTHYHGFPFFASCRGKK